MSYIKEAAIVGLVSGVMAMAAFAFGLHRGAIDAEPLYYCSNEGVLHMATGSTASNTIIAVVVDTNTGESVTCSTPGEFLERNELDVPPIGIAL